MSLRSRYFQHRSLGRTRHPSRLRSFIAAQAARIGITQAALTADLTHGVTAAEAAKGTKPTSTSAGVVTGTGTVGQTLTLSMPGVFAGTPAPTVKRQWRRNGASLLGVTGLTYTLVSADSGKSIDCVETALNGFGTVSRTSNAIAVA